MSTTAPKPATTPIPVQLSEPEFEAFILPHLSMPKRGPKCKLGYYRVFNLILWVLYTGMQLTGCEFSGEQCWFSFARVEVQSERRVRCPQKKARYSVAAKTTQCAGSLRVARMGSRGVLAS